MNAGNFQPTKESVAAVAGIESYEEPPHQQYSPASQHEGAEPSPHSREETSPIGLTYTTAETDQDSYPTLIRSDGGYMHTFRLDEVQTFPHAFAAFSHDALLDHQRK